MTENQKKKFIALCKECKIKPIFSKYHEILYKQIVLKIHAIAKKEKLYDGYYWLIDSWILEYNRKRQSTQYASVDDLKVGMATHAQDPIDFLYDRLKEIKEYRKKNWKTTEDYDY